MSNLSFHGGTLVLPDRLLKNGSLQCRDGRIHEIASDAELKLAASEQGGNQATVDLTGRYLCPGFVDIHVHGGHGADFMDGTLEAVRTACAAHLKHGTTTLYPTTSTGSSDQILCMIDSCKKLMCQTNSGEGSKIGGIHLYGPYFAKDKAGCHSDRECRVPKEEEFARYFETGVIKIATCAAELDGATRFYEAAKQNHCLITCGHSNASWTEMQRAFENGMRHVDHFWCAMSNVSSVRKAHGFPMQGSMLEFVLSESEMSTEVIADGQHLSSELLEFAWKMKTSKRLCLVTDCNRALDMPPGHYRFGPSENGAWFESNGEVGLASPEALASSIRGMDHMVRTMIRTTSAPLHEVIRMASLTPAERVNAASEIGSLEVGKVADLVVMDADFELERVYINGLEAFHR